MIAVTGTNMSREIGRSLLGECSPRKLPPIFSCPLKLGKDSASMSLRG